LPASEADRNASGAEARAQRSPQVDGVSAAHLLVAPRATQGRRELETRHQPVELRELVRFELVEPEEREVTPLVQGGVMQFGSPPRAPWARLVFMLANGGTRDVRYLSRPEIVVGREEGDLVFRDDEFLSRRHAVLHWDDGRCQLEDLQSSNGTFVRLREPVVLDERDHLRMGNQLFRFEAV
jgi:hypothetical protein